MQSSPPYSLMFWTKRMTSVLFFRLFIFAQEDVRPWKHARAHENHTVRQYRRLNWVFRPGGLVSRNNHSFNDPFKRFSMPDFMVCASFGRSELIDPSNFNVVLIPSNFKGKEIRSFRSSKRERHRGNFLHIHMRRGTYVQAHLSLCFPQKKALLQ